MRMFDFQPARAFVYGMANAGPWTLLAAVLYAFETTAPHAWIAMVALASLTAFTTAWFAHAVDSIIWATVLAYFCAFLVGFVVIGFDITAALHAGSNLGRWIFAAAVAGAILGSCVRTLIRKLR